MSVRHRIGYALALVVWTAVWFALPFVAYNRTI